jgi:excisionase family DNA binding protein
MPHPAGPAQSKSHFDLDHLPPVLNTVEAAAALRVCVREIRRIVDSGQLPAARLGPRRVIRIRRDAILALLDERTRTPSPATR